MQETLHSLGMQIEWGQSLIIIGLVMTRVIVTTTIIPFLTGKPVPGEVRIILSISLLLLIYPAMAETLADQVPQSGPVIILLFLKEVLYGMTIGFVASIVFYGFDAAGRMIDNQRGAAQARLLIPALGEQATIFGSFQFQLGVVLFLVLGGHIMFFKAFGESFISLPLLAVPAIGPGLLELVDFLVVISTQILVMSLQLAAPVIVAIFMTDLILGIMNKVSPAINVFELGFSIRGYIGVLMLFLSFTVVVGEMKGSMQGMFGDLSRAIDHLAHL